jgi:transcriptional regulator with XRE-family HTH domain
MQTPTSDDLERLALHLGDELRTARRTRGWTREQLHDRLIVGGGDDLALQTLATYELGTRSIYVKRLVQVALALDVQPQGLFHRALVRTFGDYDLPHVDVDVYALARSDDPRLRPLRAWAEVRHRQADYNPVTLVRLDSPAIQTMADLAGVHPAGLIAALRDLQQTSSPDHASL